MKGRKNRTRPLGASDELFIKRRQQAADATRRSFGHRRILFGGTAGVVVLQPRRLWSALGSLNAGRRQIPAHHQISRLFQFHPWHSTSGCQRRSWKR
jgi:hypothetical protein